MSGNAGMHGFMFEIGQKSAENANERLLGRSWAIAGEEDLEPRLHAHHSPLGRFKASRFDED